MMWLTWRQFRTQAATMYAALAVVVVILVATAAGLSDLQRTYGPGLLNQLSRGQQDVYLAGAAVVLLVPPIIGIFWGAPLIARELETGTHRLAWGQTVTRTRWLLTKLGVGVVAAMAAAAAISLTVAWWCGPIDQAVNDGGIGPLGLPRISGVVFDARGVAPIGYAAFAFVLGATVGALIKRVLPAMATTLAAYVAAQIAVPLWVRAHLGSPAHLLMPLTSRGIVAIRGDGTVTLDIGKPGAWLLSEQTLDAAGRPAALPASFLDCVRAAAPPTGPHECFASLDALHYQQAATYYPAGDFWPLQWAEAGLYLGVAVALGAFCVWWVRRRLS